LRGIPGPGIQIGLWSRQEAPINQYFHSFLVAALLCAISGCAPLPEQSPQISVKRAEFEALKGWRGDRLGEAIAAYKKSCGALARLSAATIISGHHIDWGPSCGAARRVDAQDHNAAREYFEKWFRPFAVIERDGGSDGLLTGYYEAELRGARRPDRRFKYPLYGRPKNLITSDLGLFDPALAGRRVTGLLTGGKLVPYPDRKSIVSSRPPDKLEPLVWVDSEIDAFFLHIQGSGRIQLADGGLMRVGYAASNGRPYTAIGRTLVQRGAIAGDRVSMQTIRAWLAANPSKAAEIMSQNKRYIFFRQLDGSAPVGAQGVELTPGRSLAVDRRAVPLGLPVWLETLDPIDPHKPYHRLLIAQDVGNAIKGGIRGDIFFGHGRLAARRAGLMNQRGRYYILLPKAVPPPS